MRFRFAHNNINVIDLEKSLSFYREALNLVEVRRIENPDFTLVYLGDHTATCHLLELTHIKGRTNPYNLGENEFHLALAVDDFDKAYAHHKAMNCICFENIAMGIYFIADVDGYWIEIIPSSMAQ